MERYLFREELITQHITKYGVDIRPVIHAKNELPKLQQYGNWLIDEYPNAFESQYSGPNEFHINKKFQLAGNGATVEMPTFMLSNRGVIYVFPEKIFINQSYDIDFPDRRDIMFRKALGTLNEIIPLRKTHRVGVIHEIIFDTGATDSLEILFDALRKDTWTIGLVHTTIKLKYIEDGKNRLIELSPVHTSMVQKPGLPADITQSQSYGIQVRIDINNVDMSKQMDEDEIAGILMAAEAYVPQRLIDFLNGEE